LRENLRSPGKIQNFFKELISGKLQKAHQKSSSQSAIPIQTPSKSESKKRRAHLI
jgi:hypothetical protein